MLSSKANAALTRLKEIEEKYKMKRKQQNWNREEDSSISSVSIDLSENLSGKLKESPRNVSRPKLNIKMPDMRFNNQRAKSTTNKMTSRSLEGVDKVDLGVMVPLKDKSQVDRKQENLSSDTTTIQENSSIDSVSVGSVNSSSRSVLRSKTSRQDAASNKIPGRAGRTKAATKVEEERTSDKSSEISGEGKTSLDNSSTTKRSRVSKKSNDLSSSRSDLKSKEQPFNVEAKRPETANFSQKSWHSSRAESPSDNSIIEESVDTVVDDSEIISELSRIDESVAVKVEDSTNASQTSGRPEANDISVTTVESSSKHPVIEDGYANDTFEDASSSSTVRSELKFQNDEVTDEKNSDSKGEKVMDSVASKPSVTQVDLESASYVGDLGKIGGANYPDKATIHLIKSSNSIDSRLEEEGEHYQQTEFKRNTPNASHKNVSSSKLSISERTETNTKVMSQRSSSKSMTSVSEIDQQESSRESRRKTDETGERTTMDSPKEFEKGNEHVLDERTSEERVSQVAEDALRKLHGDVTEALTKRQASLKTAGKASGDSPGRKTELRDDALTTRKITKVEGERRRSSAKNQEVERNSGREPSNTKKRQTRAKVTNSKLVKTRGSTGSRKEDRASNFDRKQMRVLRKRIVELRLRQERQDLQKYLRELKDLRLESSSTRSYFSPLEFPKIAEFTLDATDSESKLGDHAVFRERLSAIRRWLKDQYILYRDYCTMAQAINAHYVPTTLEDAKKTIRGPRKTTVKTG
ncbi:hypothetical protein DMN91_011080 [Ooceraea biroi]|uniref:Uncharacterized protein n=1 Tax=Ooceraea biroi TaxID=2015173 RepID=A0A3L8D9M3_OOCBI|nr:uncharacterized protein LOC105275359 [Ooceraea biroi]RLU17011.1 hypothetical protein DMN91_011080 [Ooceraea biroi]